MAASESRLQKNSRTVMAVANQTYGNGFPVKVMRYWKTFKASKLEQDAEYFAKNVGDTASTSLGLVGASDVELEVELGAFNQNVLEEEREQARKAFGESMFGIPIKYGATDRALTKAIIRLTGRVGSRPRDFVAFLKEVTGPSESPAINYVFPLREPYRTDRVLFGTDPEKELFDEDASPWAPGKYYSVVNNSSEASVGEAACELLEMFVPDEFHKDVSDWILANDRDLAEKLEAVGWEF